MSLYLKIILIIFGLAYLISPVDIIPDLLLPYIGWIDDGVIIWSIYYLIRHGRLPNYFFKQGRPLKNNNRTKQRTRNASDPKKKQSRRYDQQTQDSTSRNGHPRTETDPLNKASSPFDILGIQKNADKEEIQKAYKEAIKKYHPDKLSHLGEEFSTLANEKFLEIQKAYDELMK